MTTPATETSQIQRQNFLYVQIDAVGVSISNVAAPFLPVFLTRLGASNFQVGLLSSMPGVTGLLETLKLQSNATVHLEYLPGDIGSFIG